LAGVADSSASSLIVPDAVAANKKRRFGSVGPSTELK